MTLSLTLMGRETDALWRERITAGEGGILLDFSAPIDAGYTEIYPLNVWGWRRWLRKRNVERISWYEPDGVSWPVVWAAQWEKIPVDVHLTSARAVKWLRKRRWFLRRKIHYIPSALGWDAGAGNVHVRPLHPNAGKLQGERITQIKNFLDIKRVKNDTTPRPLRLLAVSRPGEKGLRLAVWTASMVRYVVGSVQLVIAGRVTPEQQQRIA
ncbi:MAG: hypothetical protein JW709_04650, partial [Sedimentisphaerales bacterium]|nr:hypothetical protein [Sedimentisphaerales bacterium]